jgi:uncharacterized Ntn-hydrolase superfamily protein
MTYTVLARCPRTHQIGIGITTFSLAVGSYTDGLKSNVGGSITQANVRPKNNQLAISLLEQGFEPESVLTAVKQDDLEPDYRQIAIIDRYGETAAFSGDRCRPWAGHLMSHGVISFGNGLKGPHVTEAMHSAYLESKSDSLELRLIEALEAGRDAGGQGSAVRHAPERSSALVIYGQHAYPDIDLRIDMHDTAVEELRRIYTAYLDYQGFYRSREKRPSQAMSVEEHLASINYTPPVRAAADA